MSLLLQGYDKKLTDTLVAGFNHGFCIPSSIPSDPYKHDYENHRSVRDNVDIMQYKEKAKQRFAGPFASDPFPNMVFSPLGLIPKKEHGEFRLIHDISFPKANSVNSHILPEFITVTFQMLDHCVEQLVSQVARLHIYGTMLL